MGDGAENRTGWEQMSRIAKALRTRIEDPLSEIDQSDCTVDVAAVAPARARVPNEDGGAAQPAWLDRLDGLDGSEASPTFPTVADSWVDKTVLSPNILMASAEQYRKLAAVLHYAQLERGVKVLMVASALPAEGKTLTAANLALTLSGSYHRQVLLVDADLRRPMLHTVFQVAHPSGSSDACSAGRERELVRLNLCPRLTLLTAARPVPGPIEVITSDRMRRSIREARTRFDWVVIDSPPVGALLEANLLTALVDAIILVVAAEKTPYRAVTRAIEALGRERISGVVLNRVDDKLAAGYACHDGTEGHARAGAR